MTDLSREERDKIMDDYVKKEALNIVRLQEMAGLTFKEAVVYVNWARVPMEALTDRLDTSTQSVHNLMGKAKTKIAISGYDPEEILISGSAKVLF